MTDWSDGETRVLVGGALERLRELADGSVHALVTDPPAGISFMDKDWDTFPTRQRSAGHAFADGRARPGIAAGQEFNPKAKHVFIAWLAEIMAEAHRVLKPGALGLVWAIPRTAHWTADALEEAGFEIHPNGFIGHLFGGGFPKHRTHLKPGLEVWWLVRKPGPGGLSIDTCRLPTGPPWTATGRQSGVGTSLSGSADGGLNVSVSETHPLGRWPANVALSHSEGCRPAGTRLAVGDNRIGGDGTRPGGFGDVGAASGNGRPAGPLYGDAEVEAWECEPGCPVAELNRQSGIRTSGFMAAGTEREGLGYRGGLGSRVRNDTIGDRGGASRFFYQAKASAAERSAGLPPGQRNVHPTVKPLELMRWLCRLVTPPGGVVLDPFMGSGTTGCAALLEGFGFVGIEQDEESARTAIARIRYWGARGHQPALDLEDIPAPDNTPCCAPPAAASRSRSSPPPPYNPPPNPPKP